MHWHAGAAEHRIAAEDFRIADDEAAGVARSRSDGSGLGDADVVRRLPLEVRVSLKL
jgi:hypothetical protein